jgi:hypothetical protein
MARLLRRADICPTGKSFYLSEMMIWVLSISRAKNIQLPFFGKL